MLGVRRTRVLFVLCFYSSDGAAREGRGQGRETGVKALFISLFVVFDSDPDSPSALLSLQPTSSFICSSCCTQRKHRKGPRRHSNDKGPRSSRMRIYNIVDLHILC